MTPNKETDPVDSPTNLKHDKLVGLDNIGNTCYMNAALQCLGRTEPIKTYFSVLKLHKDEYNMESSMKTPDHILTKLFEELVT